jgi:catechol 2,3-dioxygenase-like lactoylglutathione lyase family enzyme
MPIELDHAIVSSHTPEVSGRQLAALLDVPCGSAAAGPFFAVYVNASLTLDFIATDQPFQIQHLCFRVDEARFDDILGRLQRAGIAYRSNVHGPDDGRVNTTYGGRLLYWNQPDGHQWEILTVSYARQGIA